VVLSDDVAWCRERLEGVKDVVFPHNEKDKVEEEQKNQKKSKKKEEEREEKATRNFVPGKEKTPKEKTEAERHRVPEEERWRRKMNFKKKNEKKKKEKVIMDTDPDRVVEDFILLTQMNRTVYDYGSFGFWSAVLSGTGGFPPLQRRLHGEESLEPVVWEKANRDRFPKKVWSLDRCLFC
jgi:hypothetical protein